VFSVGPCQGVSNGTILEISCKGVCKEITQSLQLRIVGYSPDSNEVSVEAEEFTLLQAVTLKRLVTADLKDLPLLQ
jgi:hypothetical protein